VVAKSNEVGQSHDHERPPPPRRGRPRPVGGLQSCSRSLVLLSRPPTCAVCISDRAGNLLVGNLLRGELVGLGRPEGRDVFRLRLRQRALRHPVLERLVAHGGLPRVS